MSRYVKPGVAERALGVDRRTLFKWSQSGGINCIQPGGEHGQRLYDLNSVTATGAAPSPGTATSEAADEHLGGAGAGAERADYIYARVSTRKQGDDLKTQIASLKERHPDAKVLSDCASGLNFKRKGLKALLELAFKGRVRSVFIAHRDRLCRFAYDLLQHVLERHAPEDASASETPSQPSKPRKRAKKAEPMQEPTEEAMETEPPEEAAPMKRKVAMNKRQRPINGVLRTFKVRMVPTAAQKVVLREAFAGARWVYNMVVKTINDCNVPPNMQRLRDAVRNEPNKPECVTRLHDKIIAGAVQQACDAFKTNFAKMAKQQQNYKFRVKFRSYKHSYTETLRIERAKEGPLNRFEAMPTPASDKRRDTARTECLAYLGGGLKAMGGVRLQDKPEVIGRMLSEGKFLQENGKIQWDKRTGSFWFIYCYDMPVPEDPDPQFLNKEILSGDIGVDPFVQWYKPDGSHGEVLKDFPKEVKARCLKLDALQSRIEKRKTAVHPDNYSRDGRKRRRTTRQLRRKLARDRRRLHNLVEAAHYDAANFLLSRADILVVPKIASKRMSERQDRNIRSGTVRTMLTSSPGLFCQRLESTSVKYPGRHAFTGTGEPGTSGTVGCCGWWNSGLKVGMKRCPCLRCGVVIDRQVNGARNNLLAAIGKAVGIGWDGCSA